MNIYKHIRTIFSVAFLSIAIYGCTDKFEDHVAITDPIINDNLFVQLSKNSNVSEFNKLLVQTGFDKIIAASKTYTVFAPVNSAITALDPAILSDTGRLNNFIRNHIAVSAFRTDMASDSLIIKMLNGKNLVMLQSKIDEVNIITPNKFAENGIYHIVENALLPKLSIWEYLSANKTTYAQANYITSLDNIQIYPNAPINTGDVLIDNEFIRETYNVRNENNKFTLFLMQNTAYDAEVTKLIPYLIRGTNDSTRLLASAYTVRDLVFAGELTAANLPANLISKFGVNVPINRSNIVQTIKASNGLIHIMSNVNVSLADRLTPTIIEGENPSQFIPNDRRANTYYRQRLDNNGITFRDLMVQNHAFAFFEIAYNSPILYSTKYRVFWRAVNDIQTNVFQQRLRVGGKRNTTGGVDNPLAFFPYRDVPVADYSEVLLGEFEATTADRLLISLIGQNTITNGNNTLTLDYLKLVPILK
ncbi:fasciclin domain-containing protein [Pedobacter alpinus]|uniref:Fasciclin domain-containing protein n=1 Tax=Pedobacter alpinus TaxID=1590643 RepID=A0ABW5TWW8_9SPHI